MDFKEIGWRGMDWIPLAHYRNKWRTLVNTIVNLRLPKNSGKFLIEKLPASEEVSCSAEFGC
jgi:hypothetical protein